MQESIVVLRINASLYPDSANCWDSLGEAYAKANQKERAIEMYEYVLQLDPQSTNAKEQLEKLRKQ
ncbi:MAG: tetratricopeptide repeat protein [Cyclobacteriaceae bacterium]